MALSRGVLLTLVAAASAKSHSSGEGTISYGRIDLGPRIDYLVNDMEDSPLKHTLQTCLHSPTLHIEPSDFSIGHRGACMQFPEHTLESYRAAIVQGAGIVECDVAVTSDGELVCRHAQCDLHTTTNILEIPELAAKCTTPFVNATAAGGSAQARCCTSDITLAEFKTLCGKMDAYDSSANSVQEYMDATASWRTDLYSTCGTVVSHKESVALMKEHGVKFTPELKSYTQGSISMTYDQVREKLVQEYLDAGVDAKDVWLQSFVYDDIKYWIDNHPDFGHQAVFLDGSYDGSNVATFDAKVADGLKYVAPPMWMLLKVDNGHYAASDYAIAAKAAGLHIITWTLERSGLLVTGGGWYYQSNSDITDRDGDMFEMLHVLAQDVGIEGMFSDWPATTTFYANCVLHPHHDPLPAEDDHADGPTCGGIREEYRKQRCCGQPSAPFELPKSMVAASRCSVCVVGCAPYSEHPYPKWSKVAHEMAEHCNVMIHVGDTQSGSTTCNASSMAGPLETMITEANKAGTMVLYTLGDNEVNDCHRAASAGKPAEFLKAEDARNFFIDRYFKDITTDMTGKHHVTTHSADCPMHVYVETCGAAVITLEVPGSQWYLADESASRPQQNVVDPIADRMAMHQRARDCTFEWLNTSFARASQNGLRAVVIAYHAGFWENTDGWTGNYGNAVSMYGFGGQIWNETTVGYKPYQILSDKLVEMADHYPNMMIYTVHADWHFWHVQSPMKKKNLVNVGVEGSTAGLTSYARLSIDTSAVVDPVTVKEVHVM